MGADPLAGLISDQIDYYRARAREYDATQPVGDDDAGRELVTALRRFAPCGRVLELACGTGLWTVELAAHAADLTAVDASPEMLALNRERVGRDDVRYVRADLFDWTPPQRYDAIFFAAWLSHVPPQRFAPFWQLVADALAPGGRVFVIDETPAVAAVESPLAGTAAPAVERRLSTGERFRAIKVLREPHDLVNRLADLGWRAQAHTVGWRFYYLTATR